MILVAAILGLAVQTVGQENSRKEKDEPQGTPVLWRQPADIASRNLYLGPGGAGMKPNLRRITFIKDQPGGYSQKFRVRDASGREWVAKVGKEAQSETAAVRLLWAVGYITEINYLVPRVNIRGKGTFENVRFEARPKGVKRLDEWKWEDNPFVGTRELQGLKVMMVLLNNWDTKDANNVILSTAHPSTGARELQYVISDLGATLGKTGKLPIIWRITRSRNDPEGFSQDKFIDELKDDGRVDFHFTGKKRGMFNDVTIEQARWIGGLLARLSNRQLRDVFRASNYSPEEIQILTAAVKRRIKALVTLPKRGVSSLGLDRTSLSPTLQARFPPCNFQLPRYQSDSACASRDESTVAVVWGIPNASCNRDSSATRTVR
jgi:hypothetical protein